MMQGPHFRHLTPNYVAALGLAPFLHERPVKVAVWVSDNAAKPRSMWAYDLAVVYNHMLYVRAPDGLSWDWKE